MKNIQYINRENGELVTENPPGENYLKFLYHNPFGSLALSLVVKRKFLSAWYGRIKDKPKSTRDIQQFIDNLGIDMSEALLPISEYKSFNEFFYRKLKPEARPIGQGLVSPADAKLIAFENVNELGDFFVKGRKFTLKEYLNNEPLAIKFKKASLFIFRLAPNDYHRYHFPYGGKVSDTTKIKGSYLSVSPYALHANFTRVFCENKREYLSLQTKDKGEIILSPVGATMVGGIHSTFVPNTDIHKGDEMGYFSFGGSTIVMLVDRKSFKIDQDILNNTKNKIETAVKMGEQIAN